MYIIAQSLAPFGWEKNGLTAQGDQSRQYKDVSNLLFLTCGIPIRTDLHLTNPKGQCHRQ